MADGQGEVSMKAGNSEFRTQEPGLRLQNKTLLHFDTEF